MTMKQYTVSAIIPVYEEEKTVGSVIGSLLKSPYINEVICINDSSTDHTKEILKTFQKKIKSITLKQNHGKGYALATGIKRATGDIVVFFDADLLYLTQKHIERIVSPLLQEKVKVVLGYPLPQGSEFFANRAKNLTGERAYFKKDLTPYLKQMAQTRFGIELYLNSLFPQESVKKIPLRKLTHLYKHEKYSAQKAVREYMKEGIEIATELGKREGLLPRDFAPLTNLDQITHFSQMKEKIKQIKNRRLKKIIKNILVSLLYR